MTGVQTCALPILIEQVADTRGIVKIKICDIACEPGLEPWIHANRKNNDFLFEISCNWKPAGKENQIDRKLLAELYRILGGADDDIVDRIAPVGPKGMIYIDDAYSMSSWSNDREPDLLRNYPMILHESLHNGPYADIL